MSSSSVLNHFPKFCSFLVVNRSSSSGPITLNRVMAIPGPSMRAKPNSTHIPPHMSEMLARNAAKEASNVSLKTSDVGRERAHIHRTQSRQRPISSENF